MSRAIIEQALEPEAKLSEDAIGERFGASRTIVCHAPRSAGFVFKRGRMTMKPDAAKLLRPGLADVVVSSEAA